MNIPYLQTVKTDVLYHLGLDSSMDLSKLSKVKVVCLAGSADRAKTFAQKLKLLYDESGDLLPIGGTDRGSMYLIGEVISVSHGMGIPSCLIFLHEIVKLLYHAQADLKNIDFIRLGTSGGLGTAGGHVVVAEEALDATLQPGFLLTTNGVQKRQDSFPPLHFFFFIL
eukprot:GEMP01117848.1.p1 GENE.GEMP01117848.1~~GEMP01117848.1.p1  ORF type:complete len:168 (+),score=20.60 GEMP01117848.1:49-552(+)